MTNSVKVVRWPRPWGSRPGSKAPEEKDRLIGISKRGDADLRGTLIRGARAVVSQAKHKEVHLSRWVTELAEGKFTSRFYGSSYQML